MFLLLETSMSVNLCLYVFIIGNQASKDLVTVQRTTTVKNAECAAYHQRHPRVTTLHPQAIVTATEMIWIRTEARARTSTYTSRTLKRRIARTVTALQIRTATKLNRSQSRTSPATKAVPPVSDHFHLASPFSRLILHVATKNKSCKMRTTIVFPAAFFVSPSASASTFLIFKM